MTITTTSELIREARAEERERCRKAVMDTLREIGALPGSDEMDELRTENERLRVALKNVIESIEQDSDEIAAMAYAKTALAPTQG